MINGFIKNIAQRSLRISENDYKGDDGFYHCGVCNEPKQRKIEGLSFPVPCLCLCERRERAEREAREAAARERERIVTGRRECFRDLGDRGAQKAHDMRFENDRFGEGASSRLCRAYADCFEEMLREDTGLILHGTVGTGKTFLACCICNRVIERGFTAAFLRLGDIAQKIGSFKENEREEARELLCRPDLIVFDDFGVERRSEYMDEGVQKAIDIRYSANKPIIITTNKSPNDFKRAGDDIQRRVFSRLVGVCKFVCVGGDDKRKAAHNEREDRFYQIIGEGE